MAFHPWVASNSDGMSVVLELTFLARTANPGQIFGSQVRGDAARELDRQQDILNRYSHHAKLGWLCVVGLGRPGYLLTAAQGRPHVASRAQREVVIQGRRCMTRDQQPDQPLACDFLVKDVDEMLEGLVAHVVTDLRGNAMIATLLSLMEQINLNGLASSPLPFEIFVVPTYMRWHKQDHRDPSNRWLRERAEAFFDQLLFG